METPKTGTLCWFDFATTDEKKSMPFFKTMLGWNFQPMGPNYWMIEVDKQTIGGLRLETKTEFKPTKGFTPYFTVPSVKEGGPMITKAGGTLDGPAVPISNGEHGYFQNFRDINGNLLAIWSAKP